MSQEIYIDVNYLTESERDIVLQVLARDEELRRQEKRRIGSLKEELDSLRKTGATKEEKLSGKVCSRCKDPFGLLINSGALCPKCKERVCNKCRKQVPRGSWLCSLCARLREVRAESGAWFYEQISRKKGEKPQLYGSALLRASIRRSKPTFLDDTGREDFQSPPPPPVIKQELKRSGLHKPIPVHMSPLKEQTVEDSNEHEVNSNYRARLVPTLSLPEDEEKPYAKAVPVAKDIPGSDDEEADNSSSSQSSRSSTPSKTNDTSSHQASEQPSSEELMSVEMMSHKYDRHSSSSSESEKDDEFASEKLVPDDGADANGNSYEPQISAEERKSGVEFENFLENNLDEAFQPKESVVESAEEDKAEVPSFAEEQTEDEDKQSVPVKEMPAPPTIVTTDATQDENVADAGQQNNDDDIDHAFATYGIDLQSRKLGDQFSMGSRESIVSYYSDAGDGVYGNVAVTGSVQFGLKYDKKKATLEVQIHSASEIAAVDEKKQRSDPYIKVYLLPDRTKGGKRKTKTKKHTLNPVFDEILTFKIGFDELLTRTLWLTVWNHDRFGHNEFLGEVMLPFDSYLEYGFKFDDPTPQWYNLCERRPEPSLMTYCGELELALMYRPAETIKDKKKKKKDKGELHIRLIGAKNLPAKDANGFSDPFCKSYLLPDKSKKTKQKTPVIKKNLNPVWNYSYVYDNLTQEELMDRALELTVWDHDRGTSNDFLGGVRLCLGTGAKDWDDAQGEEIETWQAMLDHPSEWHRRNLTLRSKMDSRFA